MAGIITMLRHGGGPPTDMSEKGEITRLLDACAGARRGAFRRSSAEAGKLLIHGAEKR